MDDKFTGLINQHKLGLYRMALAYLGNEQDALEAVQEAICRAYAGFSKLKEPQYFGTWVMRILINYCVDEQKLRKKAIRLSEITSATAAFNEHSMEIHLALKRLEPKQRKVVFLKYFGDLTTKEIAGVLGEPESTVKTRLYRGLASLKSLLQGEVDTHV